MQLKKDYDVLQLSYVCSGKSCKHPHWLVF